jgi:hypothetical protein
MASLAISLLSDDEIDAAVEVAGQILLIDIDLILALVQIL